MAPEQIGVGRTRLAMESLEAFVCEHYLRLVRLAGLVTRDVDQAQDAVQAALERAWRKREQANADSVRPWLDRIVVREAIRQAQGRNRLAPWRHDPTDWIEIPASTPEPAEMAVLREALGRLSPTTAQSSRCTLCGLFGRRDRLNPAGPVRHGSIPSARGTRAAAPRTRGGQRMTPSSLR